MKQYDNIEEFRDDLLEYFNLEKKYIEEDIEAAKELSLEQMIEEGLLIESCKVASEDKDGYVMDVSENNTKLRTGDKAIFYDGANKFTVQILENGANQVKLVSNVPLKAETSYQLIVDQCVMLDPYIALAENIEDGMAGGSWYKILLGLRSPKANGSKSISDTILTGKRDYLNDEAFQAYKDACHNPSVYCIQGPPGTGKTDVLGKIASTYSSEGNEVLIISHTHTAVNNALNKIASTSGYLPIIKIGEELKGEELDDKVVRCPTYNAYLILRKTRKKKPHAEKSNDIVGMTLQSAVINIGLRKSNFSPSIILVDEAGQIPFAQGSLIGSFKSGCIVLIGDDRQMPPIFHEKLLSHPFSISLFTYMSSMYPEAKTVLTTTYRMNKEITEVVSKNFYEPYGIQLESSEQSANRHLSIPSNHPDERIANILSSNQSIHCLNVSQKNDWEDSNEEEALFVAELAKEALGKGLRSDQFAIITPYRRQVKAIRESVINATGITDSSKLPLIDTVERLQGQDVDMIILSTSITDPVYFSSQRDFILNPNRLNVMISRAKMKVVVIGKYLDINNLVPASTDSYINFCLSEPEDGCIMIEDVIDTIFDNGQYCEQMGQYLGFISGKPFLLEFGDNFVQLQKLTGEDNTVYREFEYRVSQFSVKHTISYVFENTVNSELVLRFTEITINNSK